MPTKIEQLLEKFQGNAYPAMLDALAEHLGVSADSLRRLALGWAPIVEFKKGKNYQGWWVIPERDGNGKPVGLSLRSQDDCKVMLPGTKHGLVYEVNADHERGGMGYQHGAHNWIRTMDAGVPCPVCEKPDGCLLSAEAPADPKAVICIRVKDGAVRPMKFGFLHIRKTEGNVTTGSSALPPSDDPIVVVEGMSDTAAAMDLGFVAVGRPSNLGCMDELADLARSRPAIVVGENDRKTDGREPGKEGMIAAHKSLSKVSRDVVMVLPPPHVKDLRAWKVNYGLTREGFLKYVQEHGQTRISAELKTAEVAVAADEDSQAAALMVIADQAELFHDGDRAYATVKINGHSETFAVHSEGFRSHLCMGFFKATSKAPDARDLDKVTNTMAAKARYEGKRGTPFIRFGHKGGRLYLDLANTKGQVVEISPSGPKLLSDSPIPFIRPPGMEPLPVPEFTGSVEELRPLLTLDDAQFTLVVPFILASFNPAGTLPVLVLRAQHGSGKSFTCDVLQQLIDPNKAGLRTLPSDERDLLIAASNSAVLVFDNISHLDTWLSDAFCRIASGTGFGTRTLYSNTDETLIHVRRQIILNGIEEVADRGDLLDRAIVLALPPLEPHQRRSEASLREDFERLRPRVLGGCLSLVAAAMKRLPEVSLHSSPRLVDYTRWAVAIERAMGWEDGTYLKAFADNQRLAQEGVVESNAIGPAILSIIESNQEWTGTVGDLFDRLNRAGGSQTLRRDWPKTTRGLTNCLDRLAPTLKTLYGVEIVWAKKMGGHRRVAFRRIHS